MNLFLKTWEFSSKWYIGVNDLTPCSGTKDKSIGKPESDIMILFF